MVKHSPLTASCSLVDIDPDDFLVERLRLLDIDFYRHHKHDGLNADLKHLNNTALVEHFIRRGEIEGRIYNKRISDYLDAAYYREAYPGLCITSEVEARTNWMYRGAFAGRSPNSVTTDLLEAKIHLFQMGKVGSKSLQSSIQAACPNQIVPHLHFAHEMLITYPDCYYSYPEIVRLHNGSIKFLSGVRDPFSRIVSGWLEAACSPYSSMDYSKALNLISNAQLESRIFQEEIGRIIDWFSHQFFCGIDVFSCKFDAESGYSIVSNGIHQVFIYRLDRLHDLWDEISRFLEIPLSPVSANRSSDKGYDALKALAEFENMRLPRSLVIDTCNSRFMKHFFSHSQISDIIQKYT